MSHFAKVENRIVTQVIVIEQDVLNSGLWGDPSQWIQTSYNTRGNKHYDNLDQEDDGVPLRGNYAGIGYIYDADNDVFYPPSPFPSWVLNHDTWLWQSPIPKPSDGKEYYWDETKLSWIETTI
jgi:hypothetical protein